MAEDLRILIEPTSEGFVGYVLDFREPPRVLAVTESPLSWSEIWAWWRRIAGEMQMRCAEPCEVAESGEIDG